MSRDILFVDYRREMETRDPILHCQQCEPLWRAATGDPTITKQMLTKQLRELEADGIITRKIFAEVPPRVEYGISERGQTLLPVIKAMKDWGEAHWKTP